VVDSIPEEMTGFFNRRNPSSHIMDVRSINLLREINTRNLPGGKERPTPKAHKLTAIRETII
jgi:hypothetical protein